jgi:hypothetical protein
MHDAIIFDNDIMMHPRLLARLLDYVDFSQKSINKLLVTNY